MVRPSRQKEREQERGVCLASRGEEENQGGRRKKQGLAQAFEPFFKVILQAKFGVEVSMFLDSIFLRFRLQEHGSTSYYMF